MPREGDDSSDYEEWTEFPNDGYDYEKHMFTEERAREIFRESGYQQSIWVMEPHDINAIRNDPVFTGELEVNLDELSDEEREVTLMLQKGDEDEDGSASGTELEELVDVLMAEEELLDAEHMVYGAEDDSSMMGEAVSGDEAAHGDALENALRDHADDKLLHALQRINPDDDDFEAALEPEESEAKETVRATNECVELYLKAESGARPKARKYSVDNSFIVETVKRQLEEETDSSSSCSAAEAEERRHFQFDRSLFANMSNTYRAEQREQMTRRAVPLVPAKQIDLAEILF